MAITQGKTPFVFGMVLATLLIAAPATHAACRSPKNICKHFDDCLQRTFDPNDKDADGIRAGWPLRAQLAAGLASDEKRGAVACTAAQTVAAGLLANGMGNTVTDWPDMNT
jgi:hypothetical protein